MRNQNNLHPRSIATLPESALLSVGGCFGAVAWHVAEWRAGQRRGEVHIKTLEKRATEIGGENCPTNGAKGTIDLSLPYCVEITIQGSADLLFHKWDCQAVDERAKARKGSAAKKTDDLETYVYRDSEGFICLPGEYVRGSILGAAKFKQDPRSPRKSAVDLCKAGIVSLTPLATLGVKNWDYEDRRRVTIQKNAITRVRPAMKSGWTATVRLLINLPEYIDPTFLNDMVAAAGKLIGVGDFRPSFGRYQVVRFEVIELD